VNKARARKKKREKATSCLVVPSRIESFSNLVAASSFPCSPCATSPNKKLLTGHNLRHEKEREREREREERQNTRKIPETRYTANVRGFPMTNLIFRRFNWWPFNWWNINILTYGFILRNAVVTTGLCRSFYLSLENFSGELERFAQDDAQEMRTDYLTLLHVKRERDRGQKVWLPYHGTQRTVSVTSRWT